MKEFTSTKIWLTWRRSAWMWFVFFCILSIVYAVANFGAWEQGTYRPSLWLQGLAVVGIATLLTIPFWMWIFARWTFANWQNFRRTLVGLAVFATLVAIFYTEENWRGKRAWENCKRECEAKGYVLDWNKFIPPAVPDDQNFFAAPKMQEWFVKNQSALTNDLTKRLLNPDTTATNLDKTASVKYLAWSDQFQPDFDSIRQALERPYARMAGDYSKPYEIPIPNFVAVRLVAQVLAQRARCHLLLNQPKEALKDLTLMHNMCRLLEGAPTHKPITLVSSMINVAITGLYIRTVQDGFSMQAWQEPQMTVIQKQLQNINLLPFVTSAFRMEQVATVNIGEKANWREVFTGALFGYDQRKHWYQKLLSYRYDLIPQGWKYQNIKYAAELEQTVLDCLDPANGVIQPKDLDEAYSHLSKSLDHWHLFQYLAAIAIPNFTKAWQTTAYNQTLVNEAQIACALERYRLANGKYPETLDALVPQFIKKIPHDIIGGQPLHYRRTEDGKFLLYSVGWNETDDGGVEILTGPFGKSGNSDHTKGDWVWKN